MKHSPSRSLTSRTSTAGSSGSRWSGSAADESTEFEGSHVSCDKKPKRHLLGLEIRHIHSLQRKGFSRHQANSIARALAAAAVSSLADPKMDIEFINGALDRALGTRSHEVKQREIQGSMTLAKNQEVSLPQLIGSLASSSMGIIERQQDEILCLRLAIKELLREFLLASNTSTRNAARYSYPDVVEFKENSGEEEKLDVEEVQDCDADAPLDFSVEAIGVKSTKQGEPECTNQGKDAVDDEITLPFNERSHDNGLLWPSQESHSVADDTSSTSQEKVDKIMHSRGCYTGNRAENANSPCHEDKETKQTHNLLRNTEEDSCPSQNHLEETCVEVSPGRVQVRAPSTSRSFHLEKSSVLPSSMGSYEEADDEIDLDVANDVDASQLDRFDCDATKIDDGDGKPNPSIKYHSFVTKTGFNDGDIFTCFASQSTLDESKDTNQTVRFTSSDSDWVAESLVSKIVNPENAEENGHLSNIESLGGVQDLDNTVSSILPLNFSNEPVCPTLSTPAKMEETTSDVTVKISNAVGDNKMRSLLTGSSPQGRHQGRRDPVDKGDYHPQTPRRPPARQCSLDFVPGQVSSSSKLPAVSIFLREMEPAIMPYNTSEQMGTQMSHTFAISQILPSATTTTTDDGGDLESTVSGSSAFRQLILDEETNEITTARIPAGERRLPSELQALLRLSSSLKMKLSSIERHYVD